MKFSAPQQGELRPSVARTNGAAWRNCGQQGVAAVHPAVEVAKDHERNAFLPAGGDPVGDYGDLVTQFQAGAVMGFGERQAPAACFQVDGQDAKVGRPKMEGDVGATAQMVCRQAQTMSGLMS